MVVSTFINIIRFRGIADAATKQASRESERVTRGQPVPATCGRVLKRKLTAVSLWSRWNQKTLLARLFHQRLHVLAFVFSQGSEFSSPYFMRNRTFSFKSGVLRMFRWLVFSGPRLFKTSLLIGDNYNQSKAVQKLFLFRGESIVPTQHSLWDDSRTHKLHPPITSNPEPNLWYTGG